MSQNTMIQWCDSSVNPTTGCDGCELWGKYGGGPCYAGHIHEARMAESLPYIYAPSFTTVRLAPGRMRGAAAWPDLRGKARPDKPWLDGMPRTIFIGDMADIFSNDVPFDYIYSEVIQTVMSEKGRRHIWMILTKRGRRMAEFAAWLKAKGVRWPSNLWAGVSVTNRATIRRIESFRQFEAPVKFASFEPLYERLILTEYLEIAKTIDTREWIMSGFKPEFQWAIIGGESAQPGVECASFDLEWARWIIEQCDAAGVPVFMKQLGSLPFTGKGEVYPITHDRHPDPWKRDFDGSNWMEWPEDIRVRRMPSYPDTVPGMLF